MAEGFIDTNVFIHALSHDRYADECLRFLGQVQQGHVVVHLHPLVVHELSYALPHYRKGMTKAEVAVHLLTVLGWSGIRGPISELVDAIERWRDTPGLAFVDAFLAACALRDGVPVYTKNIRELAGQGAVVPDPLDNADI